jgi:transcriptional regulator with XRE-family HTH domain
MSDDEDGAEPSMRGAVGQVLRKAREAQRWTRQELIDRLPVDLHFKTLAGYERGTVELSITRFVEMCETIGVSAPDVLAWAMQHARVGIQTTGAIHVDLLALQKLTLHPRKYEPLRTWAARCLREGRDRNGVAVIDLKLIQGLATLCNEGADTLTELLLHYTPRPVPRRR